MDDVTPITAAGASTSGAAIDDPIRCLTNAWMRTQRTFHLSQVWPLHTSVPGVSLDRTAYEVVRELNVQGPLRLSDLAEAATMTKPHCSRVVDTLVQAGLIDRTIPANDRRVTILELTEQGREVFHEIEQTFTDLVGARLSTFSTEDITTFADLYTRFSDEVTRWADSFARSQPDAGS